MRLHDFILTNREEILTEWERFAATCAPASITMDVTALRNHASGMLMAIAADLETCQGEFQQAEKSKGRASEDDQAELTAAEEHGAVRAESGFTITQMVAEFRALRASVLRLWTHDGGAIEPDDVADLIRFNEAIDQALAESISEFSDSLEDAKEMFLAILGHDLRSPMGAIYTTALVMSEGPDVSEVHRNLALQISERAMRTTQLVGDLLDFTRSRLGRGIPITPEEVELRKIVEDAADEIKAAYPGRTVRVEAGERQTGQWDAARISQALSNLMCNAIQHGAMDEAVTIEIDGGDYGVAVRIHNQGAAIPADRLDGIFNPLKRRGLTQKESGGGPTGNLGLGLYIAERIVHAHGGRIEVESSADQGTTFSIHLPRVVLMPDPEPTA